MCFFYRLCVLVGSTILITVIVLLTNIKTHVGIYGMCWVFESYYSQVSHTTKAKTFSKYNINAVH